MGRKKFQPGKNGESKVVNLVSPANGVCTNKLFYANRLKEFRAIAHLTQAELASQLGLSVSAIANWEGGRTRPDVSNIVQVQIAYTYKISKCQCWPWYSTPRYL